MNLYIKFFNKDDVNRKSCYFSGKYYDDIYNIFGNMVNIKNDEIENCIGYFIGEENQEISSIALKITNYTVLNNKISFDFLIEGETGIKSKIINNNLFKLAKKESWCNQDQKYTPSLFYLEKAIFDEIRKNAQSTSKFANDMAKISDLKSKNNWIGIVDMYQPISEIELKFPDVWGNEDILGELAFAFGKLAELKNGLERDKNHLMDIRLNRQFFYKICNRCIEINPNNAGYFSMLAYRHYLNVMEITKQRGRKDDIALDEIELAKKFYKNTLHLDSNRIKDNYRLGYLLLNKLNDNIRFNTKEWTKEIFDNIKETEIEAIGFLQKAITLWEDASEREKARCKKEYIGSLYHLGIYNVENPTARWNEYICNLFDATIIVPSFSNDEMNNFKLAKGFFEKCLEEQCNIKVSDGLVVSQLVNISRGEGISPVDILYRLGQTYFMISFDILINCKDKEKSEVFVKQAEKYLKDAVSLANNLKSLGIFNRSNWHLNNLLAELYILEGKNKNAVLQIEYAKDSYIKNTLGIAYLLLDDYSNAERILLEARNDRYNKAVDSTLLFLAWLYQKLNNSKKLKELDKEITKINKTAKRCLPKQLQEGA